MPGEQIHPDFRSYSLEGIEYYPYYRSKIYKYLILINKREMYGLSNC